MIISSKLLYNRLTLAQVNYLIYVQTKFKMVKCDGNHILPKIDSSFFISQEMFFYIHK